MKRKQHGPVILKRHSRDCYALKNTVNCFWPTPWSHFGTVEYRDSIGRIRTSGGSRWWRIRCNCTHCPAEIIVSETTMLCYLPSAGYSTARR